MMAEKTTWIKIDRNILNWGWYKDTNTKAVFLHLLITANVKPNKFLGVDVGRGEVATSYPSLAENLGISIKCVRTAIKHLQMGGEVAVKRHPRFSVISILRYDYYQGNGQAEGMSTGRQRAGKGQQSKNERMKEYKNPRVDEVVDFIIEEGLKVDARRFFEYYEEQGWQMNGEPIRDWKAVCRRWSKNESASDGVSDLVRAWINGEVKA